jgi:hypothetical protein
MDSVNITKTLDSLLKVMPPYIVKTCGFMKKSYCKDTDSSISKGFILIGIFINSLKLLKGREFAYKETCRSGEGTRRYIVALSNLYATASK